MEEDFLSGDSETSGVSYPQDYSLNTLSFLSASGQRIELKKLLVSMSYYEDIFSFATSGSITLTDAQGFLESLQLTGNEFIEINFGKTKGGNNTEDQIFRVYKVGDRTPSGNLNSETYTLYFCSEELLLSEQLKISKSFKGKKISVMVKSILTDYLKVQSTKIKEVEETTGVYDFLIPRLKPFEAISWLSCYARPKTAPGADFLFFETRAGYNFRSMQSLFKDPVYATYKYQAKNIDEKDQSIQEKVTTVLDYEFGKPYDMLNEVSSGTMANQLISIDPLTRSYKVTNFDYKKFKSQSTSLNSGSVGNNYENRLGKPANELYESVIKVAIGNSNQTSIPYIKQAEAGVGKDIFIETYVPNRTAQIALSNYTTMKVSIPGDPGIAAGRVINFNLMTLKPSNETRDLDKFYSGKYLVTAVRHMIDVPNKYLTILELAKDSAPTTPMNVNNGDPVWKAAEEA